MNDRIGYDELLESRVKQLKEIDDSLELMQRYREPGNFHELHGAIRRLRLDLGVMIERAQEESNAF